MKKIVLAGFAAISIVSCTSTNNANKIGSQQQLLSNTKWEVADNTIEAKVLPYLSFDPEKGMAGSGGCNRIFSTDVVIKSKDGSFSVKNVGATKMSCPNMDMNIENNFIRMIETADKYVVDNDKLELYKGSILLLKFKKSN